MYRVHLFLLRMGWITGLIARPDTEYLAKVRSPKISDRPDMIRLNIRFIPNLSAVSLSTPK